MKRTINDSYALGVAVLLAAVMTIPAWAHHHKGGGPCAPVWKACVQAGHKGKDAKQCVETIKGGGTVDGVTVSASDLQACQASSGENKGTPSGGSGGGNGG